MLLNLRRTPQHTHDLGHPGAGNTFLPCDLDPLFPIGRHGGAIVAILGGMDDPEPNLGLERPGAGSRTGT